MAYQQSQMPLCSSFASVVSMDSSTSSFTPTSKVEGKELEDLLRQAEDALDSLDKSLRKHYDTAMEIVPNIVAQETPMIIFLRTMDYDPIKAAKRLAMHWKYRHEFFKERWLLPLVQTGRGALTLQDIALLRTGCIFVQPGLGDQKSVVCVDFSKAEIVFAEAKTKNWNTADMCEHICFYCATICSDEDSQTRGALLLYPVTSKKSPAAEFRPSVWEFMRNAAPMKLTGLLVPQAYEPHKQELLEFKRVQTATVAGFNTGISPNEIYANNTAQTLRQLENAGVNRDFVPFYLGGRNNIDAKIADWTRMRLSLEEIADSPCALVVHPKAGKKRTYAKRQREEEEQSEEDFIRKRNAIYSRRMYHKRKLQTLALQEEIKLWEERNVIAREETSRLESLVSLAIALVAPLETKFQPASRADCQSSLEASLPLHARAPYVVEAPPLPSFDDFFESNVMDDMGIPYQDFVETMYSD